MKIMTNGEWGLEIENDPDVILSKEDVLADAGITSRMLTSLIKKGTVKPKCFDDPKKLWFSEEDLAIIKEATAGKKKAASKPKEDPRVAELETKVEALEVSLANQKAFILGLAGKIDERFKRLESVS